MKNHGRTTTRAVRRSPSAFFPFFLTARSARAPPQLPARRRSRQSAVVFGLACSPAASYDHRHHAAVSGGSPQHPAANKSGRRRNESRDGISAVARHPTLRLGQARPDGLEPGGAGLVSARGGGLAVPRPPRAVLYFADLPRAGVIRGHPLVQR